MHFRRRRSAPAALLGLLFVFASSVHAQAGNGPGSEVSAPAPSPPAALDSPRSTFETFVEAMEAEELDDALACLDLSGVTDDSAPEAAVRLYGVINRIGWVPWSLPSAAELQADPQTLFTFFPLPDVHRSLLRRVEPEGEIVLARQEDGRWLFSEATTAGAWTLYQSMRRLPLVEGVDESELSIALWIESRLPASLVDNSVLGLQHWQWIGLFILIALGVVIDFTVRGILALIARAAIARRGGEAKGETLKKTVRPFGLAVAAVFWLLSIHLLGLPDTAMQILLPAVKLFAMLAGVWAAYRLTDLLTEVLAGRAAATSTKIDDLLIPMLRKAVKVFILVIGLIYIADSFDIEILPLLTGLGIGSLAFAFAAKDTIENFFGSVAVITDRPFEVGDWVKIHDVEGTVEQLGFRSTRIRTFYNSLVTVPNATLVRATVDNFGKRKYRRWKTHVSITYDTPPDRIEAFCEGIRELVRVHPYTRKDYYQVWLHQFSASSLDVLVYIFHEAPDWQTELRERHRMMIDIIRLAEHLGVDFAFPTQTIHMARNEGDMEGQEGRVSGAGGEGAMSAGRLAVAQLTKQADWRKGKPPPYAFDGAPSPPRSDDHEDSQVESKIGGDSG